jgi:hypothetical protein
MRDGFRTGAAVQSASSTRRDLLLESLALRHQLSVLTRSNRRFRPSDRLLWLLLRWLWPRWREALVLVQPATVDRWHREGFRRCWRRRSRRPGRPRIESPCRDLIRRLAAENCLWGAPRIHGELLKLGIAVSERTVSRYLRDRPTTRSQTWRTFLANHLGNETFGSLLMSSDADGDDVVLDTSDLRSAQRRCRSMRRAPPFTGGVSIGLVRSNTCLVAYASPKITFTTLQAREHAAAGTRRAVAVPSGLTTYRQKLFVRAPAVPPRPRAACDHWPAARSP